MELEDFVRETIVRICLGVTQAQDDASGGTVNPAPADHTKATVDGTSMEYISFDLAVTAEKTKKGKGKISVAGFGGVGADVESKSIAVSRIQFRVPVQFAEPD